MSNLERLANYLFLLKQILHYFIATPDETSLAARFGANYLTDPARGYGAAAHEILAAHAAGRPWMATSSEPFGGTGSMGNGGAMRSAPLGAYFFDDLDRLIHEANKSAIVTHFHPEGQAGALAVALASAWFSRRRSGSNPPPLFEFALQHLPNCEVRAGIERASELQGAPLAVAIRELGNGSRILALDTVPFVFWCVSQHPDDYVEALWLTVSGLGDRDTTCAMVGGILGAGLGPSAIPDEWRNSIEDLTDRFGWKAIFPRN